MKGLTSTEARLVEQYVSVLDYLSRCAQAIDGGDWYYLAEKAASLAFQARRLAAITAEVEQTGRRSSCWPRPEAIRGAVAWHGRHYRAGRLLHPSDRRGRS
jgi:hypothetical protein